MSDTPPISEPEAHAESPMIVPEDTAQPAETKTATTSAAAEPAEAGKPASKHIGRKIWYGFVIFLSGLIILVCVAGAIGTWVVEVAVADASVALLGVVESGAGRMRQAAARVDGLVVEAQQVTIAISQSIGQVSENITDTGLVMTLLPEEQEQKLAGLAEQTSETFFNLKELVASGLQMYRTIDRMPFISLPGPDPEQVDSIQANLDSLRSDVSEARSSIQDVRSGAAARVDRVTNAAVLLAGRLQESHDKLAALDSELAAMQEQANQLQQAIPTILFVVALLLTLFLLYVGYTQVEIIRLFVGRWKGLG